MEFYFYVIFFISFLAFFTKHKPSAQKNKLFIVVSIVTIILFQGLRKWTVGIDVVTYLYFFEKLSNESIADFSELFSSVETGFLYYNKLIALFVSDNQMFLGIVSATIFIPIGYVIYKNSLNFYLSLIVLISFNIYNFTFSGIRQSIAIALTFLSYEFIKKRQWIRFVLLIILASTFHKSAFVFLPAYLLYVIKIKKKHFFIIMSLVSFIFIFKSFLLNFFVTSVIEKYENNSLFEVTNSYTMFFVMTLFYSLSIYVQGKTKDAISMNIYSNFMLMSVIVQIAASESQIAMRAGYYYFIFLTLLLPEIMTSVKDKKVRDVFIFITLIICIVFYYLTTVDSRLNPYLFYWE